MRPFICHKIVYIYYAVPCILVNLLNYLPRIYMSRLLWYVSIKNIYE